ncbi:PA1B3 acetylhydrolase, partial [Polyodon spathula]|nr:PA1B3 acetylhydrolase [Polyodon spathula]
MSEGDSNPAATPTAAPDVHGDGRWLSLHHRFVSDSKDKEPEVLFVGDSLVQLLHQFEVPDPNPQSETRTSFPNPITGTPVSPGLHSNQALNYYY